jgi:hypothetical protein
MRSPRSIRPARARGCAVGDPGALLDPGDTVVVVVIVGAGDAGEVIHDRLRVGLVEDVLHVERADDGSRPRRSSKNE